MEKPKITIEGIRQKFPQYSDMSDRELAEAIYDKSYRDMPFVEFARKIGYVSGPGDDVDQTTGLKNTPLRLKLSFVNNPKNRETLLKKHYKEVRRSQNGHLLFKNPETNKWTTVDEKGFGLRDIADWVGMLPDITFGTVGAIYGGIPGATVGTALGEALRGEVAKKITGKDEYGSARNYATNLGIAGAAGAIGEGIGRSLTKTVSPMRGKSIVDKRTREYFDLYGGRFTPAQETQSRMLYRLEDISEKSFFGSKRLISFKQKQQDISQDIAKDIVERVSNEMGEQEAGEFIQSAILNRRDVFKVTAKSLYAEVDKLADGAMVNTAPLKAAANELLSTRHRIKGLKNATRERILKDIAETSDEIPFSEFQQIRSDLADVAFSRAGHDELLGSKMQGDAKYLWKAADDAIKKAPNLPSEAKAALSKANKFWASGKEQFNNKLIKNLVNNDPDKIMRQVIKPRSASQIRRLREAAGEEGFDKIRGNYTYKLLFEDSVNIKNEITGSLLEKQLSKMGSSALNEIFTPAQLIELNNFKTVLKTIQSKPTGLGGGMMIQLMQGGAIASIAAIGPKAILATSPIFLGPAALSRLFTSKAGLRWLTEGMVTKNGTLEAIRHSSRLATLIGKENLEGAIQ